jgi:hypothetical protein
MDQEENIAREWREEIKKRLEEYRKGEGTNLTREESMADARQMIEANLSPQSMKMLESSVENLKKGIASEVIDVRAFRDQELQKPRTRRRK